MTNIFFQKIKFYKANQSNQEFLEAKTLFDKIKSNDEMSLKDIDYHKSNLKRYIHKLLVEKQFMTEEARKKEYFFIEFGFKKDDYSDYLEIKISLNFQSNLDFYKDWEDLREYKFFNDIEKNIRKEIEREINDKNKMINHKDIEIEQLKKKIMILEQEEAKEKIPTCYKNINFKNLNDLNSAKFITDNEKRMILGLKPINNN
jgi:hypothetical protein